MDLVRYVGRKLPYLKHQLLEAHMSISAQEFIARMLRISFIYAFMLSFMAIFPLQKAGMNPALALLAFPFLFIMLFGMQKNIPLAVIRKRAREMDNEALFAGRYLLIKLSSGRPLFNALIDASNSYGVASKFFKEVVDDITFGTPIEQALENAQNLSPSRSFQKILFQINNALRVGIDVTRSLESTLKEIESEQEIEIERYGKKLSTVAMFYMLAAIVIPSLGLTIFVVVASLLNFALNFAIYATLLVFIITIQLIFISVFKKIRPTVNI